MILLDILYALFIQPIEWGMGFIFTKAYVAVKSYGLAIILLSLVVNLLLIPVYRMADTWQAEERSLQERMSAKLAEIKQAFTGQERFMMTRRLYKINNYHPLLAVRNSVGLLIQVPFFFAAYQLISNYGALDGVSFFIFNDLSKSDGLLSIGSLSINIMPFVMTAINLAAAYIYASNLSKRDKIQLYAIAGLFLVVLYVMPVALVLYWTMNNVFALLKNILQIKFKANPKTKVKMEDTSTKANQPVQGISIQSKSINYFIKDYVLQPILPVSLMLAFFLWGVIDRLPSGVNKEFVSRLSKLHLKFLLIVLGITFILILMQKIRATSSKIQIKLDFKYLILLLLPLTPVANYIVINIGLGEIQVNEAA